MKRFITGTLLVSSCVLRMQAQDISFDEDDAKVETPFVETSISLGFNYDWLRPPTSVSFEYPKGYLGFNIPFEQSVNPLDIYRSFDPVVDSMFADTNFLINGEEFKPTATARQSPNYTLRVDVPALGGVCSFSNIENVSLSYLNQLGVPGSQAGSEIKDQGVSFFTRGVISVPVSFDASWETMTFGYAYRVNRQLTFAFNLHRHIFRLNMRAKIGVELLGYADIDQDVVRERINLDYSLGGSADANYSAEAWSPSFGIRYWRFTWTSRFGIDTKAKGSLFADYTLPFFVDPETFEVTLTESQLLDPAVISQLAQSDTVKYTHKSTETMTWKMPQGHTVAFDIIRDKLTLSYTKTVGNLETSLNNIWRVKNENEDSLTSSVDTIDLKFGITTDNMILLSGNFRNAFFNIGIFTLDMQFDQEKKVASRALKQALPDAYQYITLGDAPMLPVLNFGSALGTKMQLLLELDVLPLLALKTGVIYYF
ncbi:MAG: hypothetical protein GF398_13965 [Chitinivibrionales bacterium]|nr:hypothetical protein [Chitinivibrionales bacterium]